MKSITIAVFRLVSGTLVGHGSSRRYFNSLANSDLGDFRKSPSFLKQYEVATTSCVSRYSTSNPHSLA